MRRAAKRVVIDLADATEILFRIGRPPAAEPAPPSPDPPTLDAVTADIIATIAEGRRRLTTSKLLAALEARGCVHGETTVKRRLAAAVRAGLLTNTEGGDQPGYGLPPRP